MAVCLKQKQLFLESSLRIDSINFSSVAITSLEFSLLC